MNYNFGYIITPETTSLGHGEPEYSLASGHKIDPKRLLNGQETGIIPNDLFFVRNPRNTIDLTTANSIGLATNALESLARDPQNDLNYLAQVIYHQVAPQFMDDTLSPADQSRLGKAERNSPLLFKRFDQEQLQFDGEFIMPLRTQNHTRCIPLDDMDVNIETLKRGISLYDDIGKHLKLFPRHSETIRPLGVASVNNGTSLRDLSDIESLTFLRQLIPKSDGKIIFNSAMGTLAGQITNRTSRLIDIPQMKYQLNSENTYSGKGSDRVAVFTSALGELLERYQILPGATANWPEGYDFELKRCSIKNLTGRVMNPESLGTNAVYHDREQIYWIQAKSMKTGEAIWAPLQAFFLDSNLGEPEILVSSSNGAASGSTLEDAKLQAILELVERDAVNSGWFSQKDVFKVLPQESNPELSDVLTKCEQSGLDVNFIDYTNDIGIPVFRCVVRLDNGQIISGEGAHLNGEIAITRALYEMLGHIPKLQETLGPNLKTRNIFDYPNRKNPIPNIPHRNLTKRESIPNFSSNTVRGDLEYIVDLFTANGGDPIWADMTHKDIGWPTVRVLVPGITTPIWLSRREISNLQYKLQLLQYPERSAGQRKRHRH